jgi:hypothetical protein
MVHFFFSHCSLCASLFFLGTALSRELHSSLEQKKEEKVAQNEHSSRRLVLAVQWPDIGSWHKNTFFVVQMVRNYSPNTGADREANKKKNGKKESNKNEQEC